MITDYYNRGYGNYVVASGDCIVNFFGRFLKNHNDQNVFDEVKLKNFMLNNVNRLLYSFGSGLTRKSHSVSKSRIEKISKVVDSMRNCPFTNEATVFVDSGGFQLCMGYMDVMDIPKYCDIYCSFIESKYRDFTMAYSLDIPVVKDGIFKTYEQLEQYNKLTYTQFSKFPQEIKDKIFYIHHFITPRLYHIWNKFLWEDNLAEGFSNFSVGGIVAGSGSDHIIPLVTYCIPLSDIVKYCKFKGIKKFNFHLLGGASYSDIFYHQMFTKHIKTVHDIDVNITYDSSTLFKGLAVGRFTRCFKSDGNMYQMDLHSVLLHTKFDKEKTVSDCIYDFLNDISDHYNMKHLDPVNFPIYENNTYHRAIHMFLMMHEMRLFREIEMMCQDAVEELYPLYSSGKVIEFGDECLKFIKRFNGGKLSDKLNLKCSNLDRSLDILTKCDTDLNKHLVDKYMANDDVAEMLDASQMTI